MAFSLDERRKPINHFAGVTTKQIYLWMDNYCRANPLSSAMTGSSVLYQEMSNK